MKPGSEGVGAISQTAAIRQRMLNYYLQRLILMVEFTHPVRLASPVSSSLSKPLLALVDVYYNTDF